jgi:DNA-binding protein
MKSEILHISEFVNRTDLFTYDSTNKNVDKYKPLKDIFIDAISLEDGKVDRKKITEYSVHRNLKMFSIEDAFNDRFEKFWVSNDHSVIVFDELDGCYLKIKPEDILETPYRFSLVQLKDGEKVFISCEEISIKEDKDKTEAFDFTVEDYFTFCTHDGIFVQDTAAIFAPLTLEAQEDCAKLMHIPTGTKNIMQSSIEIKHEIILVAYILTDVSKVKNKDIGIMKINDVFQKRFELGVKNHVHESMTLVLHNNKKIKTTIGRAIFNSVFPKEFLFKYYNGFIDETITSKFANNSIIQNLYSDYEAKDASLIIDELMKVLRFYVSIYPSSLVLEEFLKSKKFDKLKEKLSKAKTFPEKQKIIDEIDNVLKNEIDKDMPMISDIIKSGSRGNTNQLRQMLVSKGILQDAQGNMLFIDESYVDGLSPVSTFMGGYGGRKGIMDRSRQTATTGYLFRKLIYAMASVMFNEEISDCQTKFTVPCKITKKNMVMLRDRFIIDEKKKKIKLTNEELNKRIGQTVNLRSPIYCKTHRICKTCYGDLMGFYHSIFIGIIAAQTMGERGSQEMMKTFHTGGSTDVQVPDLLLQIANNNPMIDVPHLKKYFIQDGMKLKFKNDLDVKLTLRQEDYFNIGITGFTVIDQEKSDIIIENMDIDGTKLKRAMFFKPLSLMIEIYKNDEKIDDFDIIVDDGVYMPIDPYEAEEYRDDDGIKVIELKVNSRELDYFMIVELSSSDMNVKMQTILGILEKKNIIKHPEVAFNKLTKIYGDDFGIAYNHIEILISQIFRNKSKPEYPARLFEPYDAKVYSIKNISHLESFLSGLLFENISKSLQNGFISDSTIQNPLEKLLSDDFDF